jgi:4'-phosphopantetheinyl transferase EntD
VIGPLFPPGVVTVVADETMADEPLHPEEARLAEHMSETRRGEFALGRACARRALAQLGISGPVLRDEGRAPIWPEGVVGSLTHCDDFCAAAVALRGEVLAIGIDAEPDTPLRDRVGARVCTAAEREHLAGLPGLEPARWEKLVFSAKESFYKAYFSLARSFLGFHDVEVRLDAEAESFEAVVLRHDKPGPHRAKGRFALAPPHVLTAVTLLRGHLD